MTHCYARGEIELNSAVPRTRRGRPRAYTRQAVALLALALAPLLGCDPEREDSVPSAVDPARSAPAQAAPVQAAPNAPIEPAAAATSDRPSIDQNMGRGFQGTLGVRLERGAQAYGLRYLSRGNGARLQIDTLEKTSKAPTRHLDALIWGENISLLDHKERTIRTFPLAQVVPKAEAPLDVSVEKTGERVSLLGVICEQYQLSDGPLHASACVAPLPGTFDVDKFEAVSNVDVPGWLEQLVKDELIPLRGHVTRARGVNTTIRGGDPGELYSFELVEYSPGPVDEAQLTLPENYRVIGRAAEGRHTP